MTIAKEVIEQVKRTDLAALVTAKGIALKKNGKSWFGLCPFHADKNPSLSINPIKNLFQCSAPSGRGCVLRTKRIPPEAIITGDHDFVAISILICSVELQLYNCAL
jgi:hypothetical protein